MNGEGLGCCVPLCRLSTIQGYLVKRISRSSNPLAELCTTVWSYICLKERNIIFLFSQSHLRRGCFFSKPHKGTIWLVALGGVVWPNCDIFLSRETDLSRFRGLPPRAMCRKWAEAVSTHLQKGPTPLGPAGTLKWPQNPKASL